jgi:hypothetical protein
MFEGCAKAKLNVVTHLLNGTLGPERIRRRTPAAWLQTVRSYESVRSASEVVNNRVWNNISDNRRVSVMQSGPVPL